MATANDGAAAIELEAMAAASAGAALAAAEVTA